MTVLLSDGCSVIGPAGLGESPKHTGGGFCRARHDEGEEARRGRLGLRVLL